MQLRFNTDYYAQKHLEWCHALDNDATSLKVGSVEMWHNARRHGLSGSQIAAVMGMSKWQSPFAVWSFITGRTKPESDNRPSLEWGHRLEPVVAQKYAEQFGANLVECPTLQSQEYPFLVGSVDRLVVDSNGTPVKVLEIKTASMNHNSGDKDEYGASIKEWGPGNQYSADGRLIEQDSQVPLQYILQVTHYMIITGLKQADIAVLMSTNDYRVYTIDYDEELAQQMIEAADRFWCENVLDNIMPPLKECDAKTLKPDPDSCAQATSSIVKTIEEYKLRNAQLNELKEEVQELRDVITGYIGTNEVLVDSHHAPLATYKMCKPRETFDTAMLKLEHPDVYAAYVKQGTPYRRLVFK